MSVGLNGVKLKCACGACKTCGARERARALRADPVARAEIAARKRRDMADPEKRPRLLEQKRQAEARRRTRPDVLKRIVATQRRLKYGLTREQCDALLARNACDICGCPGVGGKSGLHIDHDANTGKVRGLLCRGCNTRLVAALESPLLDRARTYLATPPGIFGRPTAVAS